MVVVAKMMLIVAVVTMLMVNDHGGNDGGDGVLEHCLESGPFCLLPYSLSSSWLSPQKISNSSCPGEE